jgi:hypothetical protein
MACIITTAVLESGACDLSNFKIPTPEAPTISTSYMGIHVHIMCVAQ